MSSRKISYHTRATRRSAVAAHGVRHIDEIARTRCPTTPIFSRRLRGKRGHRVRDNPGTRKIKEEEERRQETQKLKSRTNRIETPVCLSPWYMTRPLVLLDHRFLLYSRVISPISLSNTPREKPSSPSILPSRLTRPSKCQTCPPLHTPNSDNSIPIARTAERFSLLLVRISL